MQNIMEVSHKFLQVFCLCNPQNQALLHKDISLFMTPGVSVDNRNKLNIKLYTVVSGIYDNPPYTTEKLRSLEYSYLHHVFLSGIYNIRYTGIYDIRHLRHLF